MAFHPREGGRKIPFRPISRREFMRRSAMTAAGATGAAALLAACKPNTGPTGTGGALTPARQNAPVKLPIKNPNLMIADNLPSEQGPLKLYNWEDYINPRVVNMAQEALGVPIVVTTFNTMSEAISKLTSANVDYDVFFPTKDVIGRLVEVGILRPLNHSYLSNLSNVWDSLGGGSTPNTPFYDVGSQYTVPYTIYTTGIGYRVDSAGSHITMNLAPLEQQIPAMEVPYDIFWNTQYKSFVHLIDDYRESIGMAILRRDLHSKVGSTGLRTDVNTDNASNRQKLIDGAKQDLVQWVSTMQGKFDVSDYTDLPEGQSYIHAGWSGDFVAVQWYYPTWSPRDIIRYWYPPENSPTGGIVGSDCLAVLAGGKNPVLAHKFLNYMLNFDNAMTNFKWNGYIPPQKGITDPTTLLKNSPNALTPYNVVPPSLASCIVTEQNFQTGYELLELLPEVDGLWKDAWQVVQTAT